ncbi:hypothetical protein GALL_542770 [mine drainage metagenome]|uniref:Uncharacterized protein n=1 Tax=mine drainage metagenome TaxID=410659 RepID=A0A1J5PKW6_9ZZZZ
MRVLQALHGANQRVLNVKRQTGGNTVGVILVRGQTLGFQKNLVAGFVRKAVDLVFNTGAIAWSDTFNLAGEHRAAVKAAANDVMRAFVGMGDPARHLLWMLLGATQKTKHRHLWTHAAGHAVSGLLDAAAKINGAPVNARRRTGFQSSLRQPQFFQARAQGRSGRVTGTASRIIVQTDMNLAIQKSAGRQHHGAGFKSDACLRQRPHHPVTLDQQIFHRLLE